MIRHQTVSKYPHACLVEVLLHQPKLRQAILIFRESFTAVYAPLCNVAGYFRQHTSISARHAQGLYKKNRSVQAVPFFPESCSTAIAPESLLTRAALGSYGYSSASHNTSSSF